MSGCFMFVMLISNVGFQRCQPDPSIIVTQPNFRREVPTCSPLHLSPSVSQKKP